LRCLNPTILGFEFPGLGRRKIEANFAKGQVLCRLENRAGRREAWLIQQVLLEQFVESFSAPPKELILDFDCTDDRVHGMQVDRAFHGYYYDYCFLPLYV
jgi:hypothetical protein